jgi:hypothetical protein
MELVRLSLELVESAQLNVGQELRRVSGHALLQQPFGLLKISPLERFAAKLALIGGAQQLA